jgi:aryl-alcohol dehydrogenase-like predicted oxidoreductase
MAQLKTDIAAADLTLSEAVLEDIENIHLDYPNPCP